MGCLRDGITADNDHVGLSVDDLASQVGEVLGPALAGIPLDCEILSLDIAQPDQLREKRPIEADAGIADRSEGAGGADDGDPVLLCRLLRARGSSSGSE